MTARLAGRRILSCRPLDRAGGLHTAIELAGGTIVHLPLIEVVEPVDGGAALRAELEELDRYDWIACTSAAGVAALGDVERPQHLCVAAVGAATAEAFESRGWTADLVATDSTARGLARSFPEGPGRVLAPLGELAGDDLRRGLEERGFQVHVVTAYRTVEPELSADRVRRAAVCDAVVLSSPSVVHRLVALLGGEAPRRGVAYGPRSEATARAAGFEVRRAATPAPHDVVAALGDLFGEDVRPIRRSPESTD